MAKELSTVATKVYEVLKGLDKPVTLAELKELVPGVNSAHLTALKTRGLVDAEKVEKTVVRTVKTKVNAYSFVSPETDEKAEDVEGDEDAEDTEDGE